MYTSIFHPAAVHTEYMKAPPGVQPDRVMVMVVVNEVSNTVEVRVVVHRPNNSFGCLLGIVNSIADGSN